LKCEPASRCWLSAGEEPEGKAFPLHHDAKRSHLWKNVTGKPVPIPVRRVAGSLAYSFLFRYTPAMTDPRNTQSSGKLIYLGACLIAAVRLAREEKLDNSPRVMARISDSVHLAYRVWQKVKKEFPGFFADGERV
jgi:hypothetical protein